MDVLTITFNADTPMYTQLYRRLADDMTAGRLRPNEKLPSKRRLAEHLGVSVNTIDGAYQMLLEEGYMEARPRSGYYVAALPSPLGRVRAPPAVPGLPLHPPATRGQGDGDVRYDLGTSLVDADVFPFVTWARLTKQVLTQGRRLLVRGEAQGERALREALVAHLREFRAVSAEGDRMIIGAGMEYLLGMLVKLTEPDAVYALEDPGYPKLRHILDNNGVRHIPIRLDEHGMRPDLLAKTDARVAYVTPTHQYPMGTTLPVGRRLELIGWAEARSDRWLVEDDYDSEFRYSGRPLPAMSGLTTSDRVVYIGTMSRSIAPSIRLAYMILPEPLMDVYRRRFGMYACTVSVFEQRTLAAFIQGGHLVRHLNRMRTRCGKHRHALIAALTDAFGSRIRITGASVGLHLLVTLADGPEETVMVRSAAQNGVRLHGVSEFVASPTTRVPSRTVVLGYAALRAEQIPDLIHRLQAAWTRPPAKVRRRLRPHEAPSDTR